MEEIRKMTPAELEMVLGWARDEGWNPGLEDAQAFYTADPDGFFLKTIDGTPAAAISVVNHSDDFAFLGLYICIPEFRGQGHGISLWNAALKHAGSRCVGLDGVPDQQDNYRKSGFEWAGRTVRFGGTVSGASAGTVATPADMAEILQMDEAAQGYKRAAYLSSWLQQTRTRKTLILRKGGKIIGYATGRACHAGMKIGPLWAKDVKTAWALIRAHVAEGESADLFIDVEDSQPKLSEFLESQGFAPAFETARMYLGTPPKGRSTGVSSVATLELG